VFCFLFYILSILCTVTSQSAHNRISVVCSWFSQYHLTVHARETKLLCSVNLLTASATSSFTIDCSLFRSSFLQLYIFGHFNNRCDSRLATRYGLGGPEIESRCSRDIPHPSGPTHPASPTTGTRSFQGVRRPRRVVNSPPLSNVGVKGMVEPYFYSPLWLYSKVRWWNLPFLPVIRGIWPFQYKPSPFSISKFPAWGVIYRFYLS
jgi:hypothetical protein